MSQIEENDFTEFSKNKLFVGFKPEEVKYLYSISRHVEFKKGDSVLTEGDKAKDLFFITKGELEISKKDPKTHGTFILDTLGPNEVVGQISFIDSGSRSASVKAITPATVRAIAFEDLESYVNQSVENSKVYVHLLKTITQPLRDTGNITLEALKRAAYDNKVRIRMGNFIIYVIILISIFIYVLGFLKRLLSLSPNTTYIALPFTLFVVAYVIVMIKASKIAWKEFKIDLTNWKEGFLHGLMYVIPWIIIGIFVKWLFIQFNSDYAGRPLLEPFAFIQDPEQRTWENWLILNCLYWFVVVPIQELIARGVLQGMLEHFLVGKHRILLSILVSNLLYGVVHIYFSLIVAINVLIGGFFIGYIYSRNHNLITSIVIHAGMGTALLSIVGVIIT